MNKRIVELWDKNKDKLKKHFATTCQSEYDSYLELVKLIVTKILNSGDGYTYPSYDANNITLIDDGDWQGTQIFIIPQKTYQPSASEYLVTYSWYGSCSGCDTLQSINMYGGGMPDKNQVDDYMTLCLHLIQRMKPLYESIF